MVELGFKNDICIGIKYVLFVFSIFQPNPESFSRAIIFSSNQTKKDLKNDHFKTTT
jgi:hypothetical protein